MLLSSLTLQVASSFEYNPQVAHELVPCFFSLRVPGSYEWKAQLLETDIIQTLRLPPFFTV